MLIALVMFFVASAAVNAQNYASKMKLWYSSASGVTEKDVKGEYKSWFTTKKDGATKWMEYALPIGNGQLGATFIGNVDTEYLQFNEKTLWTGDKDDFNYGASSSYDYGAYQNFGYLKITTGHSSSSNYSRELDLSTATGKVSYTSSSVNYTREFIASYPGNVVVARFSANKTGKQNLTISLTKGQGLSNGSVSYSNGVITLSGSLTTVSYGARIKVVNVGGSITTNSSSIKVSSADEVYIILAAGTNFDANSASYVSGNVNNVLSLIDSRIASAESKGWNSVYNEHVNDYQALFNRVEFDLTGSSNSNNTQTMVSNYSGGTSANDLMLDQLYFAYGRYLEIASSRGVSLPSNLQGLWNNISGPKWNSDIHANINVQMNYWPAEVTNLGEMHTPFLDWIINMSQSEQWKNYAKKSGQSRGWTTFTENNIFGGVGYWMHNSTVQNAWFCSHLWQHYEYTRDVEFLRKAFPAMLGATQFWLDRLVLASDGTYECPNEYSPEQGPESENAVAYAQQLVRELFDNTLKAVEVLGTSVISSTDLTDLQNKYAKLDDGLGTETYTGSTTNNVTKNSTLLREWKYSNYNCANTKIEHRHLSHLMCLYPFNQVDGNSEYFQAAKNSLQLRGDAATGWAMGWKINLWARALDGNHAHTILEKALKHSTTYAQDESKGGVYYNLWSSHAPFQIDGNFGATAGITEMLFQSHNGVLNILPALPNEWKNGGYIKGLKGRGNFTVGFEWGSNGELKNVNIVNVKGEKCLVKCGTADITTVYVAVNGTPVLPVAKGNGVYEIPSQAGSEIEIDMTREPGVIGEEPAVVVETPTFSPAGGEVQEGATVSIACATEGATIYYTTNGAEPTTSATKYTGAIAVNSAMTIKAIAVKDGYYTNSAVASASFTIKAREVVATPVISPAGGEVEKGASVTIACATEGATIYYTTNGAEPTTSATKYTGAIAVNSAMTIKAIAVKDGYYTNSAVASASFTVKAGTIDDATMQAIASAQAVAAYSGVGYPSSDAATRVALNNVIAQAQAGNATVSEIESAVDAFKNEVSDITMPEDGKTYKFVNVTKSGKKYYINYASSGISMVTNEAQATEYTCEFISHDEYAFIASNGSYLVWKGPNTTTGFLFWKKTQGYNDNKGYTSSYNSTYCDLIVEKLTKGDYVSANSNAELFGLMGIRGMRYSRNEYSYFTIKSSNGAFDASVTPYFNASYSSAFYIVDTNAVEMASEFDGPTSIEDNVTVGRVINDDAIYDITGRKVTETRPGKIYIKNGKKFLAK